MLPVPLLAIALLVLVVSMGLASPASQRQRGDELRAHLLGDFYRLQHAVEGYVKDMDAMPVPVSELTAISDGGLADSTLVASDKLLRWKGPYLLPLPERPTRASFWSLQAPCRRLDADGDGADDELWAALQRGQGEIDDGSAAWVDQVLDDGVADRGRVQVGPDAVEFQLIER